MRTLKLLTLITYLILQSNFAHALHLAHGQDTMAADQMAPHVHKPINIFGFTETIVGSRIRSTPLEKKFSIIDARLNLNAKKHTHNTTYSLVTDFLYDPILNYNGINLSKGTGWLDLREANVLFRPTSNANIKIGRQILCWGISDLICINDLFPKDWNSFVIGRNIRYLSAPTNTIKLSLYNDLANVDIVYTPLFNHDRYIDGERIAYYRTLSGSIAGRNDPVKVIKKNKWFNQDEVAVRVHRLFNEYETALYILAALRNSVITSQLCWRSDLLKA
jgi:hypothetical protein